MTNPTDLKHIYWRSRRGMLELELKLVPFVRDQYDILSSAEQIAYEALLEEEDWQLFDWLQGREVPEDAVTKQVIDKIIRYEGRL
jgi:antitoxin CptB